MPTLMRNIIFGCISIVMSFALVACSGDQSQPNTAQVLSESSGTEVEETESVTATKEYSVGKMTLSIPEEWSLDEAESDESALLFDTGSSGSFRVSYVENAMNAFASTEDAVDSFINGLSSVTLSNKTKSKIGEAEVYTFDSTSVKDTDNSVMSKVSLLISGEDTYMLFIMCPERAWEGREEQYNAILESVTGADKKPVLADVTYDENLSDLENAFKRMSTFESTVLSGSGDDVVALPVASVPYLLKVNYPGAHNFSIASYSEDGEYLDLLVNEIGPYSGTVTTFANYSDTALLEVTASSDWTIECLPFSSMSKANNGDSFQGDDVVYISPGSISKVHFTHDGQHNFSVMAIGFDDMDLLVNEIGPYDGTKLWTDPDTFFIVNADGRWSISW